MQTLHPIEQTAFASDNYSGFHPEILHALAAANGGHVGAYGKDPYTEHLQTLIKQHFGAQAQGFPVFNGTGANVLSLQALLPRWGAVICAETAHINADESTAPQAVGGFKLWTVPTPDGKLSPELLAREAYGYGSEHRAQPLAVSITQSSELGTCYTHDEIRAIADYCHAKGMKLHMDGARLANACAFFDCSLKSMTADAGVDIVSFGGTKNGLLYGECIIVLNDQNLAGSLKYLRKLNLQLASKMRFLSVQFNTLLENGLWLRSARHANQMAARLAQALQTLDGVQIVYPVQSNGVFVRLPGNSTDTLRRHTFFYDWDNEGTVRLMCSFDTRPEHIDGLVQILKTVTGKSIS